MTYSDKLRSPEWQKKRLQILERDEWTCQNCLSKEKTLHVHHKLYKFNHNPWDYEDIHLITLCEVCHKSWHDGKDFVDNIISCLPVDEIVFWECRKKNSEAMQITEWDILTLTLMLADLLNEWCKLAGNTEIDLPAILKRGAWGER